MEASSPGAQTERRGDAGPAGRQAGPVGLAWWLAFTGRFGSSKS